MAILHYAHGLIQFVLLLTLRPREIILYHLPAQFDALLAPLVYHPVVFLTFHFQRDLLVKVFNELYGPNGNTEGGRRTLRKLSLQDLLALGSGMLFTGFLIMYLFMVILMNDMAHLLVNSPHFKYLRSSTAAVVVSTLLEAWTLAMWALNLGFFLTLSSLVLSTMESVGTEISSHLQ